MALLFETVTLKLQFAIFPHSSVAVNVTTTTPIVCVDPISGDCVTVISPTAEQLSLTVAMAVKSFNVTDAPAVVCVCVDGHAMVGTVLSLIVMVCTYVSVFVQLSVAVQVLVITEALAQDPAAVTSECDTNKPPVPHVVVAVANPVFAGKVEASHSIAVFAG